MEIIKEIDTIKNQKNKEINKILNVKLSYTIFFENNKLILLNENNDKILVSEYIFFGVYQPDKKLYIWSNSIPGVNKNQIKNIKDIKNKYFLFKNNNNEKIQLFYQLLTNDVLEINDKNILENITNLFLYLTDAMVILNPINKFGNVQYIGITKILEKYF